MSRCCRRPVSFVTLFHCAFGAAALSCFLYAMHRIAGGLQLGGRVAAYEKFEAAYTPEEREAVIHRIKHDSMRY